MKQCKTCNGEYIISDADKEFYNRIGVRPSAHCTSCRRKRRLAFWPFGILKKRKCDLSGETIISTYPVNARFPIYKREYWFSDKWTPPEQDIAWDRPFLDQLYELQCKTPHFHQLGKNNENCDYADDAWSCKNAYMSRSMLDCEDVYYIYRVVGSKNCIDLTYCFDLEQCYECTYCFKGFNLKFSLDCRNCSDSYFLYDCRGVGNSFMCWNLRNKEYHILNKQYSRGEYEAKLKSFGLESRATLAEFKREFREHLKQDVLHKENLNVSTENSTGNYLTNCKNSRDCFFVEESEDCLDVMRALENKNCISVSGLLRGELCSDVCQSTDLYNCHAAVYSVDCNDCYYIDQCFNGSNLFGCVGLRRREYCILNKQYTREEYEELVPRIIGHMDGKPASAKRGHGPSAQASGFPEAGAYKSKRAGERGSGFAGPSDAELKNKEYGEFFSLKFAYNGFNLSLAAFYFNETEDSVAKLGGFLENQPAGGGEGIPGDKLPDLSGEISDDLIGKPIRCANTGRFYNFIKQELDFYRQHKLPLPAYYPEQRNVTRFRQLVPPDPFETKCSACGHEITTYYPADWGFKNIVCEKCYLGAVY